MKEIIKEIVEYKKTIKPIKDLIEVEKNIGYEELSNLIGWLLHWQKAIHNPNISWPDEDYKNEEYILNDVLIKDYPDFFKHCPELSEVFSLKKDRITYNENLTEEEKIEIREYIDEHHKIKRRIRRLPSNGNKPFNYDK
ncbi:hypothetical protein [uncultured Lacinutrix sp.]|uniref:hypothetical protein n=1 Tax=uncultured Lacinutrix sp. TaxID=574032 RepID=UPI00261602B1|nr:hypothetical protein [uncultured Lacinutrix sp.]